MSGEGDVRLSCVLSSVSIESSGLSSVKMECCGGVTSLLSIGSGANSKLDDSSLFGESSYVFVE